MSTATDTTTRRAESRHFIPRLSASAPATVPGVGESVIRRGAGVVGLAAIALIHFLDLPGKLSETPYLGVMYIGLIISALVLAEVMIRRDEVMVWAATGVLAAGAVIGFCLTRTVGLPQAMGDIGNWLEPLGLASLFVEGTVILLALAAILRSTRFARLRSPSSHASDEVSGPADTR